MFEMSTDSDFALSTPLSFFEKAGAPTGQHRRFGGLITTDRRDQEGEVMRQDGMDFRPFLKSGFYNVNHSKEVRDVIGYPVSVDFFKKGSTLPDGRTAGANGHWAEGYLLAGHRPAFKRSGRLFVDSSQRS